MRTIIMLLVPMLLLTTFAQAQGWGELRVVPRETPVRVFEAAGKGWTWADGKLLLVKDDELTILRGRTPIVIPRAVISKVESRRRDPLWDGMVLGAIVNTLMGTLVGSWQGCTSTSECALAGIGVGAGFGALIDWRIVGRETVYKAP